MHILPILSRTMSDVSIKNIEHGVKPVGFTYIFFYLFFFISQFRIHSSSIEFLGFSGMYIKIGDDTSKLLWVIREHDSMYKFIQKIDIKPSVNSSIVRLVHEFIQHFNFK